VLINVETKRDAGEALRAVFAWTKDPHRVYLDEHLVELRDLLAQATGELNLVIEIV
jgi:hypothetical protein